MNASLTGTAEGDAAVICAGGYGVGGVIVAEGDVDKGCRGGVEEGAGWGMMGERPPCFEPNTVVRQGKIEVEAWALAQNIM